MWTLLVATFAVVNAAADIGNCTDNDPAYCATNIHLCDTTDVLEYRVMASRCQQTCGTCGGAVMETCNAAPSAYCVKHSDLCTSPDYTTEYMMLEQCQKTCNHCHAGCVDEIPDGYCLTIFEKCNQTDIYDAMTESCPNTCQRCPEVTTLVPPQTTTVNMPVTTSVGCVDKLPENHCQTIADRCNTTQDYVFMTQFCPSTCQRCGQVACLDKATGDYCANNSNLCNHHTRTIYNMMTEQCGSTCGRCPGQCVDAFPIEECDNCASVIEIEYNLMTVKCAKTCNRCNEHVICADAPGTYCARKANSTCESEVRYAYDEMTALCPLTCGRCTVPTIMPPTAPPAPTAGPTVAPPVPTTGAPCFDKDANCADKLDMCNDTFFAGIISDICAKTCKFCEGGCVDADANCAASAILCNDPYFANDMRAVCPVTCKLCPGMTPCVDTDPNCVGMDYLCTNPNFHDAMTANCPKTCHLCPEDTPSTPALPPTPILPITSTDNCFDLDPVCYTAIQLCNDPKFINETSRVCRKACHFC